MFAGAAPGKIFYGMMLREDGGTVDDLLVYKRGENDFFSSDQRGQYRQDLDWMRSQAAGFDVDIVDLSDSMGDLPCRDRSQARDGGSAWSAMQRAYILPRSRG